MRTSTCLLFALSLCAPQLGFAQDPVAIDPAHHKVELENADVRVLRIAFAPGEKAPEHAHPNGVAVFVSAGTNRVTTPGQKPTETPQKAGDVSLVTAGKHTIENIGKTRVEIILVELKRPGSPTYKGMALDPVKVNPKNYSVAAENEHVRVVRVRAAAGSPSILHEHPANVTIQLNDSPTQKAGSVAFNAGPEKHGGTPSTTAAAADAVIVELKSGSGAKN